MFKRIKSITVTFEDDSVKTFEGHGTATLINTSIKQDAPKKPIPASRVEVVMPVSQEDDL